MALGPGGKGARGWTRLLLAAATPALVMAGCSQLFSEELSGTEGIPTPELRFTFEGSDTEALRSTGRLEAELSLVGEARIDNGALDLTGISVGGAGSASTITGIPEFANACRNSGEFSVSLWFSPSDLLAFDNTPARILTMEENESAATNFTIGQGPSSGDTGAPEDFDRITYRAASRSSSSALEAGELDLRLGEAAWIGYSATENGATLWVKNPASETFAEVPTSDPPGIISWEPTFPLIFGSTPTGRRQWRGKVFEVELFCTALSGDELEAIAEARAPLGG